MTHDTHAVLVFELTNGFAVPMSQGVQSGDPLVENEPKGAEGRRGMV